MGRKEVAPAEVIRLVAQRYGVSTKTLLDRGGYGLEARNLAMALLWDKCALGHREIGELFGGMDYQAVAQRIRRINQAAPKELARLKREMSNV